VLLLLFTGQNIPTRLYKRVIVIVYWSEYPDEVIGPGFIYLFSIKIRHFGKSESQKNDKNTRFAVISRHVGSVYLNTCIID